MIERGSFELTGRLTDVIADDSNEALDRTTLKRD